MVWLISVFHFYWLHFSDNNALKIIPLSSLPASLYPTLQIRVIEQHRAAMCSWVLLKRKQLVWFKFLLALLPLLLLIQMCNWVSVNYLWSWLERINWLIIHNCSMSTLPCLLFVPMKSFRVEYAPEIKFLVICVVISTLFSEIGSHISCWTVFNLSELFCLIAQCKQGTYSPNGLETCETCPVGTYQPSFGSRNCISCPENTSTVKRGAVDISACGGLLQKG